MRFLIDACLPRDFSAVLAEYSHVGIDVRDIGMRRAEDPDIAAHAQKDRLCLVTEDWGFANVLRYPPEQYSGIVLIESPDSGVEEKLAVLRHLLERPDIVAAQPGRLAIVTADRTRIRPPL